MNGLRVWAGLATVLVGTSALAEDTEPGSRQRSFDFDDVPIAGEVVAPDAQLIRALPGSQLPADERGLQQARTRIEALWREASAAGAPAAVLARLAAAHRDHAQLSHRQEVGAYGAAISCFDTGRCAAEPAFPEPDYRHAVRFYREALRRPAAVGEAAGFQIALADLLEVTGPARDEGAALALRLRAAEAAPNHPLAAGNALALGERDFEGARLGAAAERYQQVLKLAAPGDPLAVFARYKLAWVHFNLGRFDAAIEAFQRARELAAGPQRASFVRQIDADLTLAWARTDAGWRVAAVYFERVADTDGARRQLRRMASHLEDSGRLTAAVELLRHLLAAPADRTEREQLEAELERVSAELR